MARVRRAIVLAGLVALVVAGALVLTLGGESGCGDGYPSTPECLAEEFVTREDASKCDLVDPALLEQVVRARGPEARERCAQSVSAGPAPEEVEILEREREEGEGTVVVEFLADGKEGSITARRIDGRWRIVSFAE